MAEELRKELKNHQVISFLYSNKLTHCLNYFINAEMKHKYILETYDRIISEIKNPKIVFDNDFVPFLMSCTEESYLIYKVNFIKENGIIKYQVKAPIHNLHPTFEEINSVEIFADTDLLAFVPTILNELDLESKTARLYWSERNGDQMLYILSDIDIEELTNETRFFFYCFHTLQQENERIKKLNKETIFNFKSNQRIEQYIHKKQYAIENLASRLIKDINPANPIDIYKYSNKYDKTDCLKVVYIYLEKILRFIEKEYRSYLDINIQIPYRSILVKEFEITDKLNQVKNLLLGSNLNEELMRLAYEPILKVSTIKIQEKITYYEFNYCSDYISALHNQLEEEKISNEIIKEILFDLNFNSTTFLKYLTSEIQRELEAFEDNIDKIDLLYKYLKNYNQKQNRHFIKYKENLPSLKVQLTSWIEEEINYLTKKIKLETNIVNDFKAIDNKIKFLTSLSVAQLVHFFNLLQETEIIKHKNQMDIFRFISDNFQTKNVENISVDSLKVKHYNVETSTKQAVREKIIELLTISKL